MTAAPLGAVSAEESHSGHDMGTMSMKADSPSTEAYKAAMDKMHREMMAMQYTGNADADFVRAMIPHHQAAIDMARVLLDHGKDPKLRKLAQNIITAQEKEITEMEDWLDAHPGE